MEWISVEDMLPDDNGNAVFVLLNDLTCGVTFNYKDAKSRLDDKTVDISFWRQEGKWHCCNGIYNLEKITHWAEITPPKK